MVFMAPRQDGSVKLVRRPIFESGQPSDRRFEIEVYAPVGGTGPLTLPIVTLNGDNTYAGWRPTTIPQVDVPRGRTIRLSARMLASTDIELKIDGVPGQSRTDHRRWMDLLAAMPRRLSGRPMDIAFLVERVGDGFEMALATGTLLALASETWRPDLLRTAVVLYGQHLDVRAHRVIDVLPFMDPATLVERLSAFKPDPNRNNYASALEDGLACVAELAWRDEVTRALVSIGSRGPHPAKPTIDPAGRCPHGVDWSHQLDQIGDVDCIAVWRDPGLTPAATATDAVHRMHSAWAQLGRHVLIDVADATVERLLTNLDIAYSGATNPFGYVGIARPGGGSS